MAKKQVKHMKKAAQKVAAAAAAAAATAAAAAAKRNEERVGKGRARTSRQRPQVKAY